MTHNDPEIRQAVLQAIYDVRPQREWSHEPADDCPLFGSGSHDCVSPQLDSLDAVEIAAALASRFDLDLGDVDIDDLATVADMMRFAAQCVTSA